MSSDSSSGFRLGYHTFLYGHIQYNKEGGRKNKRTNTDLGQLQAQERDFVTLCILRASVDDHGRVFCAKLLQKPLGMPTHLWLSSLPASFCCSSFPWTAISRQLVSSYLHCRLPLSVFLCKLTLCLLWDLPFLLYFLSRGFRAKADKEILWPAPTHTPNTMNDHIVSYIFTLLLCRCFFFYSFLHTVQSKMYNFETFKGAKIRGGSTALRSCFKILYNLLGDHYESVFLSYLPTPPLGQDMTQGQFLSGV